MAGMIIIVIVAHFALVAGGGYYFICTRQRSETATHREAARKNERSRDTELGQRLFSEIGAALSTHSQSLETVDVAPTGGDRFELLQLCSRDTSETLAVCDQELGELLSRYGDAFLTERSRIRQYADTSQRLDDLIDSCGVDSDAARGSRDTQDLVREMVAENSLLRSKVAACGDQIAELIESTTGGQERSAKTDSTTGLPGAREFESRLAGLAAATQCWAVMVIDVDHLSAVNDRYGTDAGDAMLTTIATVLRKDQPQRVYRVAGDEFAVLIPDATAGRAAEAIERLCGQLAKASVRFKGEVLELETSSGMAIWHAGESPAETWIRADRAMARAKRSGDQRYCIADEISRSA